MGKIDENFTTRREESKISRRFPQMNADQGKESHASWSGAFYRIPEVDPRFSARSAANLSLSSPCLRVSVVDSYSEAAC